MRFIIFISLCLIASACSTHSSHKDPRPNVVIFFTDDQGTLDAHCYGSEDLYTPAIDKLAEQGVRFTQAYAHAVCCPSRAVLMTGRYPQRSGITFWTQGDMKQEIKGLNLPTSEITLAEALKGVGYRTALFGKWHIGAHRDHGPTKHGFDEFYGLRGGFIDNYNHYFLHGSGFHDLYEGTEERFKKGIYFPDLINKRCFDFIERNKKQPFFIYMSYNIPHYPEQPIKDFDERYKDLSEPRRSYAKMISTTDHYIGQVIDKLKKHDLLDNTLIVFMSDNGHSVERYHIKTDNHKSGLPKGHRYGALGGGGNTGKWVGHKGRFTEGGIRVPAIISFPKKMPRSIVRDQIVSAADIMPTVLDYCAVPLPKVKLDGQSLRSIMTNNKATHHKEIHWMWGKKWATRQGSWKLLGQYQNGKNVIRQLYSLEGDKPEQKNYLKEKPELAQKLFALHKKWYEETKRP